ncbi:MAG: hypothetical protein JW917_07660 [Ignavibacteria bacterium]|nr:hypothetical protein [Ignavibacteria bacterium]
MGKVLTIQYPQHFSKTIKVYGDVNRGLIYLYLHKNPVFELFRKRGYLKIILYKIAKNLIPVFSDKISMADTYTLQKLRY